MTQKWYKKASVQNAIIAGIFLIVAAIIAGLFDLYKINLQTKNNEAPSVTNTIKSKIDTLKSDTLHYESEQFNKYKYFPENQIRVEITKALGKNNLKKCTTLLNYLKTDKAKEEEYERIFQFCIKHNKLDTAEVVSELFSSPEKKQIAKEIIAKEKYKIEKNK